ncbi:hypothetical protein [Rhodococcus opacus]|uniref:hypothetical protein n=1 Tax=Rhodococcus opacus TaxID=37919 RepID=UPI001BAFD348
MGRRSKLETGEAIDEAWARKVVEAHAEVSLELHDDGSINGMVDYRVFDRPAANHARHPLGVLEVGTITNGDFKVSRDTFERILAEGFSAPSLDWKWAVALNYGPARLKPLRERLVPVLAELERRGIESLQPVIHWDQDKLELARLLDDVGDVAKVTRRHDDYPVQVTCTWMWSTTGSGDPLATLEMVEKWLDTPEKDQQGIRSKVGSRDADQPYGGLFLHIEKVPSPRPGSEFDYDYQQYTEPLRAGLLPRRAPVLPPEITHLWLVTTDGFGWYWDSGRWHLVGHSPH